MTKNYWVKAALRRKKASSDEVLVNALAHQPTEQSTLDLIETDPELKAEFDRLLGEYLKNYRKLHRELRNKKEDDVHAPKLKSAI